jgi:nucleoside-diphosphate-sugar epimerase
MIVAITGGTGFIGRGLVCQHLAAGDTVRVLTRRASGDAGLPDAARLYRGDVVDGPEVLRPFVEGADVLYHCAAELYDASRMRDVHVTGTRNLLQAAEHRIGRWVHLSSVGVYGQPSGGLVAEDAPVNPIGTYETTKVASEGLVIEAAARGLIKLSILRPSKVFGPEMRPLDLFQLITLIHKRCFFFIGRAGAIANYAYVDNVVEGLIRCGTLPQAIGQIYNLSDWRTLEDFVSVLAAEIGRSTPKIRIPESVVRMAVWLTRPIPRVPLTEARITGLVSRTVYLNAKIERELSYAHPVTMEEGLRRMVKAWRDMK